MGANLYIRPISNQQRAKYEPRFIHWVTVRDMATTDEQRTQAQRRVNRYFDLMYAKGYFRDSYNTTNLLWKFAVSWWRDVTPRLDAEDALDPTQAQWLLATLKDREPVFKASIAEGPNRAYFTRKYRELRRFLRTALEDNEPIRCSL
jgi:hypothetical protein